MLENEKIVLKDHIQELGEELSTTESLKAQYLEEAKAQSDQLQVMADKVMRLMRRVSTEESLRDKLESNMAASKSEMERLQKLNHSLTQAHEESRTASGSFVKSARISTTHLRRKGAAAAPIMGTRSATTTTTTTTMLGTGLVTKRARSSAKEKDLASQLQRLQRKLRESEARAERAHTKYQQEARLRLQEQKARKAAETRMNEATGG